MTSVTLTDEQPHDLALVDGVAERVLELLAEPAAVSSRREETRP